MTKIPVSIQYELCVCTPINKEVYEHNKNLANGVIHLINKQDDILPITSDLSCAFARDGSCSLPNMPDKCINYLKQLLND